MFSSVLYCFSLLELRRKQSLPQDALDSFRSRKILMLPPNDAADVASLQIEVSFGNHPTVFGHTLLSIARR